MLENRITRAWKDEEYRLTLSHEEQAVLPPSPIGAIELTDEQLSDVIGGAAAAITQTTVCVTTLACVTAATYAISQNMSCGACDTTLWSGSCAFSSIGCCPPM
jgi:mersacidin/lichenicidin family type 2 lantibiotic